MQSSKYHLIESRVHHYLLLGEQWVWLKGRRWCLSQMWVGLAEHFFFFFSFYYTDWTLITYTRTLHTHMTYQNKTKQSNFFKSEDA